MSNTDSQSDLVLLGRNTLKKEAEALTRFVNQLDDKFERACELLEQTQGTVVLTGMGKSGLVARKWSSTLSSTGTRSYFINPAEAQHGDLGILKSGDTLVALSFSGETEELESVIRHAKNHKIPIVAVTGERGSSLGQRASLILEVGMDEEACPLNLAPTTSTTIMMALGDAIAVTLMQMRGFTENDFAKLHPGGSLGRKLWLRVSDLMHQGEALPKVGPDDTVEQALIEMTQKRLGMTAVMEGEELLGIITDGDLRRFFQNKGIPSESKARDMMTVSPKTARESLLAVEARNQMEQMQIQHLLVLDVNQKLAGVVHLHDLLKAKVV